MRSVGQRVEWNEIVGALWGNLASLLLFRTESPAAPYNHSPLSQFLFMRKPPSTRTTLLEGRRSYVSPNVVRLFLRTLYVWLNILLAELDIILGSVDRITGDPIESATVVTITLSANDQSEISDAALRRAEEAMNTMETWSSAIDVVKQVMDAVSQIAAVRLISFPLSFVELILYFSYSPMRIWHGVYSQRSPRCVPLRCWRIRNINIHTFFTSLPGFATAGST